MMWKRTRQKGQGLIEYALLLAIVVYWLNINFRLWR